MADLITTAELTAAVPSLATRSDLAALVSAASQAVERYCGRTFERATLTETHDGRNRSRLWLRRRPIVSVASVTINGTALDNTTSDAWVFHPATGELRRGNGHEAEQFAAWFPWGLQNIVVTYTGGYNPIPADVKHATILWARHLADAAQTGGMIASESIGDYSYSLGPGAQQAASAAALELLAPYVEASL